MTKIQLSHARTMKMVHRLLLKFKTIWQGSPGMGAQVGVLGAKLDLIQSLVQEQGRDNRGLRADKERLADLVVNAVMAVAGPLGAWAMIAGNERVRQLVDHVPSTLKKMPAERLLDDGKEVLALGAAHQGDAADYEVTPEALAVLRSRIAAFEALVVTPREGVARTAALTRLIEAEVDGGMELLRLFFDRILFRFREAEPEFFTNYQTARKVVRPARHPKRRKGDPAKEQPGSAEEHSDNESDSDTGADVDAEEASPDEVRAVLGTNGFDASRGSEPHAETAATDESALPG